MSDLRHLEVEADRARFGSLGPNTVPNRLLGILRHQLFQLRLGSFMVEKSRAGLAKDAGKFRPGVGCRHVDDPDRLDPRPGRLDPEQVRGLAILDAAPELLLRG